MPSTQDILIHAFHILLFLAASAIFVGAVIYRLKTVAKGQKAATLADMGARIRSFIFNVVLQQKLFKHPVRGAMHAFIFYGFLVYGLHTMSQMVAGNLWSFFKSSGIEPYEFLIPDYIPAILTFKDPNQVLLCIAGLLITMTLTFLLYNNLKIGKKFKANRNAGSEWFFAILLLAQFGLAFGLITSAGTEVFEMLIQNMSALVLTGLVFFAYRRWALRSKGLDIPSTQSAIVLLMIGTLMVSTLTGGAAQSVISGKGTHTWVSSSVLKLLTALGMSGGAEALAVRNFAWWAHIVTVYGFMVVVPLSKHSHLIFAPMNFFMIRGTPRGQMTHMDMENAAVYGAGNVRELPWTSMLDGLSCIECGRCTVQCPANRTGKPLDPKKIMVDIKHSMIENTNTLLKTEDPAAALIGDPFITEEELWGCTSCYACVEACPVGNNQLEAILEMRRNLVLAESRFPSHLQLAFQNMENNSNPWGVGAHTRADWCADLNVKTMAEDSNVDVLYWVGCAGSFDDRNKTIARSFVKIMQGAGVKFSILGTEENCTGDSARRGGNEYLFQTLAQTNIETMNRYNVKKVVTACPHCYNTLKNEYPQMGGNYEVQHHTDFIDDLIRDGKVEMDPATVEDMKSRRGTYHDSCYLGRYNDVYDQPRNIVEQTLGRGIPEASDHHSTSLCCGAGGAQMWMEEQYDRVNVKRTNQLLETGADTIATACPFCMVMITDGVKAAGMQDQVQVLDVAELVAASMKGGTGAIPHAHGKEEAAHH